VSLNFFERKLSNTIIWAAMRIGAKVESDGGVAASGSGCGPRRQKPSRTVGTVGAVRGATLTW
jgi:hypothetical protein